MSEHFIQSLEVKNILLRAHAEWEFAFTKHKGHTPSDPYMTDAERLIILVEEIGEVARAMTYDEGDRLNLVNELIQVAAMAAASAAGITAAK